MKTAVLCLTASALLLAASAPAQVPPREVPTELTLADALGLALGSDPGLRALGLEVRRSEARTRQAASRPNPEASLELENFAGTLPGLTRSEATLSVGQILELGGKRPARVAVARAEERVAASDLASEQRSRIAEVSTRYLEALATERMLALAREEVVAAREAAATTASRVQAGAAHPVERRRADVEYANARLDETTLEADAALARTRLSLLWGDPEPRFERLLGSLDSLPGPPGFEALAVRAEASPALARWSAVHDARLGQLQHERARRRPDLAAQIGVRSFAGSGDRALTTSVSIPLPLSNRNRGAIDEAAAALEQVPLEAAQARLESRRALAEAHARLVHAHRRLAALRGEVLPESERAYDDMRAGFQRGRFSYLDLLEARRTWIRARREVLDTLLSGHLAAAELERLTGAPLPSTPREGGSDR